MTRLPAPEQWVLSTMSEMETAEMIEQHIDYYTEDEDGNRRSVHLPTPFVRHFMKRNDNALPIVVAIATAPIVLANGGLLALAGSIACAASSSSSRTSCARSFRRLRTARRTRSGRL